MLLEYNNWIYIQTCTIKKTVWIAEVLQPFAQCSRWQAVMKCLNGLMQHELCIPPCRPLTYLGHCTREQWFIAPALLYPFMSSPAKIMWIAEACISPCAHYPSTIRRTWLYTPQSEVLNDTIMHYLKDYNIHQMSLFGSKSKIIHIKHHGSKPKKLNRPCKITKRSISYSETKILQTS